MALILSCSRLRLHPFVPPPDDRPADKNKADEEAEKETESGADGVEHG